MKKYQRPPSIPFPTVWHTFKAKDLDSDELVTYRIQDLPEEYFDEAIELYKNDFFPHEPMAKCLNIIEDKVSMDEILSLCRKTLHKKLSLACFKDGSDELIGLNFLAENTSNDPPLVCIGKSWKLIYEADVYVFKKVDICKKYGVDHYLSAKGLVVSTRYRNRGIARELLKARVLLCKALGFKVTCNSFSELGTFAAKSAGYKTEAEVKFSELFAAGFRIPNMDPEKPYTIMSLVIEENEKKLY